MEIDTRVSKQQSVASLREEKISQDRSELVQPPVSALIPDFQATIAKQIALKFNPTQSSELIKIITSQDPKQVALRFGDVGPKVQMLQELINFSDLLAKPVTVDGVYGEELRAAIEKVQRKLGTGITLNGEAGPKLFAGLLAQTLNQDPRLGFEGAALDNKWITVAPLLESGSKDRGGERINFLEPGESQAAPESRRQSAKIILEALGYNVGRINGDYDNGYRHALSAFMADNKSILGSSQQAGSATIKELVRRYFEQATSAVNTNSK